jgi:hypothetical protein
VRVSQEHVVVLMGLAYRVTKRMGMVDCVRWLLVLKIVLLLVLVVLLMANVKKWVGVVVLLRGVFGRMLLVILMIQIILISMKDVGFIVVLKELVPECLDILVNI